MKATYGQFAVEVKVVPCPKCGAGVGQECKPMLLDFCPERVKAADIDPCAWMQRGPGYDAEELTLP